MLHATRRNAAAKHGAPASAAPASAAAAPASAAPVRFSNSNWPIHWQQIGLAGMEEDKRRLFSFQLPHVDCHAYVAATLAICIWQAAMGPPLPASPTKCPF
ncbi:hypothetical protein ACLKA6_008521 [Drosophila palustris]